MKLTESCYTHIASRQRIKDIQIKISQGQTHRVESTKVQTWSFQLSSLHQVTDSLLMLETVCTEGCSPGKLTLGVQNFQWAFNTYCLYSLKPLLEVRLKPLVIRSYRSWNWYVAVQSPHHKSHCQNVQWPKPPHTQSNSRRAGYSKSSELTSQ